MKNLKVITLAIAILGFTATSFAQNTATASDVKASATIIAPLKITNTNATTGLSFGTIVKTDLGGNVVITPIGGRTMPANYTDVTTGLVPHGAATFEVTGNENTAYSLTLPADGTITLISGSNSMAVNTFTSNSTETLNGTGKETFGVGATLVVAANQATGLYIGEFNVTVAYN